MELEQVQLKQLYRELARDIVRELHRPWMRPAHPVRVVVNPVDVERELQKLYLDKLAGRISEQECAVQTAHVHASIKPGFEAGLLVFGPAIFHRWYQKTVACLSRATKRPEASLGDLLDCRVLPYSDRYQVSLTSTYRSPFEMEALFKALQISLRSFTI